LAEYAILGFRRFKALPFGIFEVNITVPADHILEATGNLLNERCFH
jgi:hypothetical protein